MTPLRADASQSIGRNTSSAQRRERRRLTGTELRHTHEGDECRLARERHGLGDPYRPGGRRLSGDGIGCGVTVAARGLFAARIHVGEMFN